MMSAGDRAYAMDRANRRWISEKEKDYPFSFDTLLADGVGPDAIRSVSDQIIFCRVPLPYTGIVHWMFKTERDRDRAKMYLVSGSTLRPSEHLD